MDFYLHFPWLIEDIHLKQEHRRFKRLSRTYEGTKPYGHIPDHHIVLERMRLFQETALQTLTGKGYFSSTDFEVGQIHPTDKPLPPSLNARILETNTEEKDLIEFLSILASYSFEGDDGLKERTSLLEFRYDAV